MRIFDSRWEGAHGIGRFAGEIVRRLDGFERISLPGSPSSPLDPFRLTKYLRSVRPALFVSPGYNAPLGDPCPFVFCVHDLNHLVMNENSSPLKRAYYRYVMKPASNRAGVVLTVSDFTRSAICQWTGLPESKVHNVGNGVSEAFTPGADSDNRPSGSGYFLYVGNHKSHKNFDRLLQAFALSRASRDFALVSTGMPSDSLRARVEQLNLAHRVKFVGEVSDDALASLYRGATALAMVSLYEGFGLPLVEAMACGTPVLTSNLASMPEVVGNAGILVDPTDVGAIADELARLASDIDLRRRLSAQGIVRARSFSWDITARLVNQAIATCA